LTEHNASQSGGEKTLKELMVKYKNAKALAKTEMSQNAEEIKKTGGITALLTIENSFNLS
jgi:hypothetical protein